MASVNAAARLVPDDGQTPGRVVPAGGTPSPEAIAKAAPVLARMVRAHRARLAAETAAPDTAA